MRVGPFGISWPGRDSDPYWDTFIHSSPADPNNLVADGIRRLPEGSVFAVKHDIHSPEAMSGHVKELARFLGAADCAIIELESDRSAGGRPFAIVCTLKADYDVRSAPGIGGQAPALKGAFVTFNLGAWIRECGYHATRDRERGGERLAARAGLGRVNGTGRLMVAGTAVPAYVADVILTDLPLAPDAETGG